MSYMFYVSNMAEYKIIKFFSVLLVFSDKLIVTTLFFTFYRLLLLLLPFINTSTTIFYSFKWGTKGCYLGV